jgi:hypothetical protein
MVRMHKLDRSADLAGLWLQNTTFDGIGRLGPYSVFGHFFWSFGTLRLEFPPFPVDSARAFLAGRPNAETCVVTAPMKSRQRQNFLALRTLPHSGGHGVVWQHDKSAFIRPA